MRQRGRWLALLAAWLLLTGTLAAATELEGFDEVEEEPPVVQDPVKAAANEQSVVPEPAVTEAAPVQSAAPAAADVLLNATAAKPAARVGLFTLHGRRFPRDFKAEIALAVLAVVYAVNIYMGRKSNDEVALAWAAQFCDDGEVLDRNFSLLGTGNNSGEVIMRQSNNSFLFYASGRRFCSELRANLELRRRQDIFAQIWYHISPRPDFVDIEIAMNEGAMPPTVLFVGQPRFAKERLAEEEDLKKFTKKIEVGRDRIAQWPGPRQLTVLTEQATMFYDVMTESIVNQVFGQTAWEQSARKYFRFLHFTTEDPRAASPAVLRFSFNLPPIGKMNELTTLMAAMCQFIDIVGSYQLPPEARKKGEKRRQEIAAEDYKSRADERGDRAAELREKKFMEEQEKMKRMTPAQRERYQEKRKQLMQKRQMKTKMVK
jgi:hypothetical protein